MQSLGSLSPKFAALLRPQFTIIAAAALSVAVLGWSGYRSASVASTRTSELRRAESVLESFAALRQRYEPAAAAESIAWRRAWMDLQDLGVVGDEKLRLTQLVARSAEASGLGDVRVRIGTDDTTGTEERPSTEGVRSVPATFTLYVECRGGLSSVIEFLGQLPPSVAPTRLTLVRQDGRGPHRMTLAVYELAFSNDVPPGWSSLERGDPGSGGRGRPGS